MEELAKKGTGWIYSDLAKAASEAGGPVALMNQVSSKAMEEGVKKGRIQMLVVGAGVGVGVLTIWGISEGIKQFKKPSRKPEEITDEVVQKNLDKYNERTK